MEAMDDMLLANWVNLHSSIKVPSSYMQPPETRPGTLFISSGNTIPVIDLGGHHHHAETINQILKASQDYGFFQVINHGVCKDLMDDVMKVFKEFHSMPSKEKLNECSNGSCKLYTSGENHKRDAVHYWKDTLTHPCPPSSPQEYIKYWPNKPSNYRKVVGKYAEEVRKLGMKILEILCEGLGIRREYFLCGGLSENPSLVVHHYPPCPDPTLTLGLAKHRDPSIITILLQDKNVRGLQVLKDHEWFGVDPIPYAFVVNIGLLLQIISNGRLIGAEHRVVTNLRNARTSVAYFINPSNESIIEPAKDLFINGSTQKTMYKSMSYQEFRTNFFHKGPKIESELHN
ncbi:hypothetical protein PIB30_061689 [Stylosanthes scabra]|uniref:Fe2OG dioxygenase domain-containing protein n=2 Tax=Stylosanthes scabra TaxID=79078 RepID=A0ABU6YLL9_9FABA|nr:hypothetical protein [Stylosanthes scabra]